MPFITILLVTPFLQGLTRRFGLKRFFIICLLFETVLLGGYALSDAFWVWCALSLCAGAAGAAVWTLSETLIALDAPTGYEGRFMAIYQTIMGLAMASGPLLASALPWSLQGVLFMIVLAYLVLIAALLTFYHWPSPSKQVPDGEGGITHLPASGLMRAVRLAPVLLVGAWVGGAFEGGLDNLGIVVALPYYAAHQALWVPAAIATGSLLAQYPIGLLADRWGGDRMIRVLAGGLVVCSLVFSLVYARYPASIWVLAPLWGAMGGGMYTVAMTMISKSARDQTMVSVTSVLVMGYSVGKIMGPVAGGFAYDHGGSWAMGLVFAAIALIGVWQARTRSSGSGQL